MGIGKLYLNCSYKANLKKILPKGAGSSKILKLGFFCSVNLKTIAFVICGFENPHIPRNNKTVSVKIPINNLNLHLLY